MDRHPDWAVYLLDSMRQQDSAEDCINDLKKLLCLSAHHHQKSTSPSQSHWGLQKFIDTHVGKNPIGDSVLEMVRCFQDGMVGTGRSAVFEELACRQQT